MNALLKLSCFLFVVLPLFVNSQDQVTAKSLGLKGPVKKVVTYEYSHTDLKNAKDEVLQTFNPSGYITYVNESLSGSGICSYERKYNHLGYLTYERCRKGCLNFKSYEYKNDSILLKIGEDINTTTSLSYTQDGQKSFEIVEMPKLFYSPEIIKTYYTYENGKLRSTLSKSFTDTSKILKSIHFKYNQRGQLSSKIIIDSLNKKRIKEERTNFLYDLNSNMIKESHWVNDTLQYEISKKYKLNLISERTKITYNSNNQFESYTTKYDYNENGDEVYLKEETFQIKYQYKYDKYGNWVERINFIDDGSENTSKFKTTREISYYKY